MAEPRLESQGFLRRLGLDNQPTRFLLVVCVLPVTLLTILIWYGGADLAKNPTQIFWPAWWRLDDKEQNLRLKFGGFLIESCPKIVRAKAPSDFKQVNISVGFEHMPINEDWNYILTIDVSVFGIADSSRDFKGITCLIRKHDDKISVYVHADRGGCIIGEACSSWDDWRHEDPPDSRDLY